MYDIIQQVSKTMQGSAGPGGIDAAYWQDRTLRYGLSTRNLQEAIATLKGCLTTTYPQCAS